MSTTFMNLTLPVVSTTLGPQWATELNQALEDVDSHDHTSGKGRKITTAALDIDNALALNGFKLTDAASLQVNSAASPVSGIGFENSLSAGTGDLYWTNSSGVPVQITSGGSIISSPADVQVIKYDVTSIDLTIGSGDNTVFVAVDTSSPRTITLPLASSVSAGRIYIIKDASGLSETNTLTVAASGADTIDGSSTYLIQSNSEAVFVVGNGINSYKRL